MQASPAPLDLVVVKPSAVPALPRTRSLHVTLLNPVLKNEYFHEFTAGVVAAAAIAPAMTVIDKAIIKAQFHRMSLWQAKVTLSKELLTGQTKWNPALSIMFRVYGATYLTANLTEVACKDLSLDPAIPKVVLTTLVNVTAIAWKDREYAKLYQTGTKVFPRLSYGLFALRDGLTVVSSFNIKHKVRHQLEGQGLTHQQAEVISSFGVPMVAQLFSTPLHILAMDVYDKPQATWTARLASVAKGYGSVCTGRILRIIPAFGVGGYLNDVITESLSGHELE